MKKILASQNITILNFYKQLLEDNGIQCNIKNYFLTAGVGDLPANAVVPELWVLNDDQAAEAKALLASSKGTDWRCECGEKIEGQFEQCWKCGKSRG